MDAFNSKEYSWVDVNIFLGGRLLTTATSIRYKKTVDKEANYAYGDEPRSIQRGNKSYEGELGILQSGLNALNDAAGSGKDVTDMNFDITVAYVPKDGGAIRTKVLKGWEVTEFEEGLAQGDKKMEITLPLIGLRVKDNV